MYKLNQPHRYTHLVDKVETSVPAGKMVQSLPGSDAQEQFAVCSRSHGVARLLWHLQVVAAKGVTQVFVEAVQVLMRHAAH